MPTERIHLGRYLYAGTVPARLWVTRTDECSSWSCEEELDVAGGKAHSGPWFRLEFEVPARPDEIASYSMWVPSLEQAMAEAQAAAPGLSWETVG